ncbi:NAD(P)-binding domain-containing protein [Demequina sediminicola]|uniref:NAD(P)-binding domain-containing protein n=1 Tax=Demequina sediminicola TaxID=1095026 RepID=UPI0009E1E8A5|nr:NAD(P)-binding domain-containing protein [Demequina sediminicola]
MPSSLTHTVPIIVIGAGQAGLSVGYHLRRLGLSPHTDFTIVDSGPGPGGAWQHRWDSLRFGDAHALADLPGMADAGVTFVDAPTEPPASAVVAERYRQYEEHFGLDVQRPVTVDHVERATGERYLLQGQGMDTFAGPGGRLSAEVVIAASGTWRKPRQPDVPGVSVFRGIQITTPQFKSARDFAGLRVAVVGGGASAVGLLGEVAPVAAQVSWFTRRPITFLESDGTPAREFGRESVRLQNGAAVAGRPLPSIVSTTGLPLTAPLRRLLSAGLAERQPMFASVVSDGVVHPDGSFEAFDAIIWALGFEADLGMLAPLGIDAHRGFKVDAGHAVDVPGIFLAGYGPQASTISANRGGRVIARDALKYLDNRLWPPRDATPSD